MKNRIVSLLLALGLLLAVAVPAQAAEAPAYRLKGIPMFLSYFVYDNGGFLPTAVVDDSGQVIQTMTYNAAGQLVHATNGDSIINNSRFNQTCSYDADGHMTESLLEQYFDAQTVTTHNVYAWENGLMISQETSDDAVATPGSDAQEFHNRRVMEYTYEGQVCTGYTVTSYTDGKETGATRYNYECDENGNPVRIVGADSGSVVTYVYDEQGRVRTYKTPTTTQTYTYAGPIRIRTIAMAEIEGASMVVEVTDVSGTVIYSVGVGIGGPLSLSLDANGCVSAIQYVPQPGYAEEGEMLEMELLYEPVTD